MPRTEAIRGRPPALPDPQVRRVLRALRKLLREHGGNGTAVAKRLGCSQSAISQMTRECEPMRPGMETARRVAKACGVDVFELLTGRA